MEIEIKNISLPCLKGVLDSKNGMTAEIIPNEPGQVMLPREKMTQFLECTLSICHRKSFFNLTKE